jgi:hypothetical protein
MIVLQVEFAGRFAVPVALLFSSEYALTDAIPTPKLIAGVEVADDVP